MAITQIVEISTIVSDNTHLCLYIDIILHIITSFFSHLSDIAACITDKIKKGSENAVINYFNETFNSNLMMTKSKEICERFECKFCTFDSICIRP